MSEKQFNQTKLAEVMSFDLFQVLDKLVQAGQTFPENAKIKTSKYFSGEKANLLTSLSVYWLKAEGFFAQRNNTTGIPRKMKDGSIKWTPAAGMKGSSDIIAIGPGGLSFVVEIKYGRDRMRPDQEKFQKAVTKLGAKYIVIRRLDDLIEFLKSIRNGKSQIDFIKRT